MRRKGCRPLFSQSDSKFRECFSNLQLNHELYFADSSVFYAKLSSPHPDSSSIGGIVQSAGGVGEQGVALVLQVEEFHLFIT